MLQPSRLFRSTRAWSFLGFFSFLLPLFGAITIGSAQVSTSGVGLVRHGLTLDGSNRIEGSLQILTGEPISLIGSPVISADLLVPGTPTIQFTGNPNYGGTLQGTGLALPSNYVIAGDGHFSIRHVVTRSNPVPIPVVAPPPLPTGTRDVTLSSASTNPGSFATIRNLAVGGNAGNVTVPPGTYGSFSVSGKNSLTLGVPGATQPAVYNFQGLAFSGNDDLRIVGPVIITVNSGITCGGRVGSSPNPSWLKLRLAKGDLVFTGNNTFYGEVVVPSGTVYFNGNSDLIGGLACDRLALEGNNLLRFLVLNTPPTASNQSVPTNEDTPVTIVLEGTDAENSPLTYTLLSLPARGTLSGTAPNLVYTPQTNDYGPDSFTFKVSDGQADSNVATVDITVAPVNDVPQADGQERTTEEDVDLPLSLTGQDIEGDSLTYRIVTYPTQGSFEGAPPQLTYRPAANFNGHDEFTFVVNDGTVDSAPATVAIEVGPVNDAPEGTNDRAVTDEDFPVSIVVSGTDADGDSLTYSPVALPSHGVLSGTAPNFTYTPSLNYHGADEFTFRANDGLEDSGVATISIEVRPINDQPTAAEQHLLTTEDTELPLVLEGNDVDGDPLIYTIVLAPAHGTLLGTPPNLTYAPGTDYNGPDSFTFKTNDGQVDSAVATVGITVTPGNDRPTATGQELVTSEDTALPITLSGIDIDGDSLTFTIVDPPQHGVVSGTPPNVIYTPAANFHDQDSFTFVTNDAEFSSEPAIIALTVTPVNDPPSIDASAPAQVTAPETIGLHAVATDDGDPAGSVLTVRWSKVSGQGDVFFGDETQSDTTASYTKGGTYILRATVSDGEMSATDDVEVTVLMPNSPPQVDAGANQTINLAAAANLMGSAQDDGLPAGAAVTQQWSKVSGPGTVTFGNANALATTANFSAPGDYVLRLRASDSELTGQAQVTVHVLAPNQPPQVNAGPAQELPPGVSTASLTGTVTDDGLPRGPGLQAQWSKVSGPGEVGFSNVYSATTGATFSKPGTYVLRLSVTDGELSASAETQVVVAPRPNQAPVVNAGADQSLSLDSAALQGSITDDGLPAGSALTQQWMKVSGPGEVTFASATALQTSVSFDYPGTYVLRLIGYDTALAASDEVTIEVRFENAAPIVNAGEDRTVVLPAPANLAGAVMDDGLPGGALTVAWTQVSGPGTASFENAASAQTPVTFDVPGDYVLRLTGNDSLKSASDEVAITVVASPFQSRTFTVNADFDEGQSANVNHNVADQLQLSEQAQPFAFIWVANSTKGTIVKINTETGVILGEYWSSPTGQPRNPSRTTVDLNGSVWATNRDGNSVLHIALAETGQCVDRNGNGIIDTSIGLNDIRPWTNANNADTNGGVATAADECIVHYTRVSTSGTRHVSVNVDNDIWVSGTGGRRFDLVDGDTGLIKRSEPSVGYGGYGGLIDRNGVIWSGRPFLRWDTSKPLTGPNGQNWTGLGHDSYGLGIDPEGNVWETALEGNVIRKWAPNGSLLGTYQHGFHWAQGCAVDKKGNVWVAHSINGGTTIGHLKTNGTYVGNIVVGAGPTGVAVDAKGKIWATKFDGTCSRIDPEAGPLGADGVTRVGAVDFTTVNLGGQLYNYSDMTGSTLTGKPLSGTWTVVHDSGTAGAQWGVSDWNALLCGDAGLTVTAATSNDGIAFSAFQPVIRGAALTVPAGRYLKLRVLLRRSSAGESPVLYDLSVGTIGYAPAPAVNQAPSISAGNEQDIAWPALAQLQGTVCDDGLPSPDVRTAQWSKISGPGTVTFGNAQALKTTAAFSEPGVYILRLDGSDSALSDFATVRITASPINTAPAVSAGPDLSAANAGDSVALRGWVGDDGLPNTNTVTALWSVLQGPGTVTFADVSMADTTAVFSAAGIYVLKLTANDSALSTNDLVEVRVGVPCAMEAPSGVVGWWPGNGDARNLISGVSGIPVGGLTYGPGAVALGFKFDGADDFLQIPASPALNVGAGDGMTIEFWINPTNRDRWQPVIEWNNGATWGAHVWVEGNSQGGRLFVNLRDTNGGNHTFTSNPNLLFNNEWQHVALTYSKANGQLRVYRNGQFFQQVGMGVFSPQTSYDLYFGRRPGDVNHFGGLLDEVTIYNRTLESELYPIATAGVAGKCQPGNNAHPFVDAGPDQTAPVTGAPVALNGLVSDDGLPAGAPVRSAWSLMAGPGQVTFADATQPATTASFSQPGIYLLRLNADDTLASASDLVEVHVAEPCSVPAPSGLKAWWTGNGQARDLVGGSDGQMLSGTTFAPGKVSLGWKFDGLNDVIRVPAAPNLDIGAGDAMTVEFWINPDNRDRWQALVEWHNGTTWGAHIHIEGNSQGGRLYVNLLDTNNGNHTFTSNPDFLRVGEFQHVAVTYDKISGMLRIWRNGERFQEVFLGRFNVRTTYDVYFGRRPGDTNYFAGVLDEIAFYNRALDTEITDIYRAGQIGKCPADANAAPVVNAGADLTLGQTGVAVTLAGSATDDGLPAGSALATHWSLVNGPGSVDFADASALVTTATFSAPGIYLLQLAANDSAKLATDLVEVRVAEPCSVPAPSGLTAWWPGNGDSRELVADNDGQMLSGTTFAPGKVSLGWKFDGLNDVIRVPAAPNLDIGAGNAMTVEFWINPDNRDRWQALVEWHNGTTWGAHIHIEGNSQGGRLYVNLLDINGGNHTFTSNPNFLRVGEFQHVAVTYDKVSGMLRVWRNGERFQEAFMGSFNVRTNYDVYFGRRPGDTNYFSGVLDEISFYNRALTFELQQIYAAGRVGKCSPSANEAPFVDAGPDQTVAQAGTAIPLEGYVNDDGLPTGSTVRAQWSVLQGPGGVTFGDANSVATTASFSVPGLYILQLAADDTAATTADTVEIRVAQACHTPAAGMVAWWPGNGDGRNVTGGPDAQLISGTSVIPAKVALGFKLDGANDFVRVPQAPELNVGVGSGFTAELWINPTSTAAQQPVLEWNNGSSIGVHMWISVFAQGTLFINIIDSGGGAHFFNSAAGVITPGTLQHVAATYNKATGLAVLYKNGQVVAQQNLGIFTPRTNYDLYFGHRPREPLIFGGTLDEVTVYNRALTAAEISAIATADSAGKCPPLQNEPPYVDAGLPQQLAVGAPATLNAVVHDDGRPDGSSLALTWSQVSGPAQAVFASPNAAHTSVNLPAIGVYVLRLTATDGVLSSSDDVSIAVTSGVGNLPPSVSAGSAQTIRLPATATLDGSAADDGVPAPLVTRWRVITGPGSVSFGNAESPATTATFSTAGNYLLRLTADDSQFKVSADVAITVHPASPDNQAPVVNAGPDEPVYIDKPASVSGAVTDDGLPTGQGITVSWTQVSGPGAASFTAPTSLTSAVQFSIPGAYVLRLTASDSDASASDEVTFNVYPALNVAPSADAGADQQVSISDGASLQGVVTDDGLPIGSALSIRWSKVSGPGAVAFASESEPITQAQFSERGVYVLSLTADDSEKRTTDQVTIVVGSAHNQPPTANAGPDQTIPYGQSVTLAGAANDDGLPNGGIMIRWSLLSGPGAPQFSGTVDALMVSFPQVGTYALRFTADDGEFTASDDITITVAPSATQPPAVALTTPVQGAVFTAGQTITLTATTSDPDGVVQFVEFYAGGQLLGTVAPDANGSSQYHWNGAGLGAHVLSAVARDNSGTATTSAAVNISVQAARPTVSITYPANFSAFAPGEPVQLHATASAAPGVATISSVEFLVNGAVIGSDAEGPYATAWTTPGSEGEYTLTARATDSTGQSATSAPIFIRVAADPNEPLFVELDPDQAGMIMTAPTALLGTVSGPTLANWILEYRQTGIECTNWITLATGTQNVAASALATLDTTLLLNGTYDVRLTARDASGGGVSAQSNFIVDGNMKVGNFTATFKDLELPLSGVPITVTRTYDSRNKCPGDFGYGWTLDVDSLRLDSTEQMGDAWSLFIHVGTPFDPSYYRLDDAGPHLVSLKMPDGQLYRFTPKLVMDRPYNRLASLVDPDGDDIGQVYAPIQDDQPIKMIYRARPGSEGAVLKARGYRTASVFGGLGTVSGDTQFYLADTFEGAISLATRPGEFGEAPAITGVTGWELTLRDGRVLLFDDEGRLEEMRDRVGNKVAFIRHNNGKIERIIHTPSGSITHSPDAKQIVFVRDGANRIKSITDPAGNAVQYRYTANGDLDAVFERGNNPLDNQPTTSFTYKGLTHLLENILDARGIQAARNFYDDDGRLEKTIDAEGNETIFTHDLETRTETIKDRAGNITVHRYDERGNVVETRAPDGTVTASAYHHWSDGTLSELKASESVTGFFTNETNPTGPLVTKTVTTHYSYEDDDPATPLANDGLLRKMVDPKGNVTTFAYDGRGNVLTVTDAKANAAGGTPAASVINTFNGNGLLETATDALGNVTTYTYDTKGNPDKETRTVTLLNADGTSSLVSVVTDRDYNALGQLEKVTDPAGHATTYEYDANGNRRFERTTRTSAGSTIPVVTETEYDEQDRPIRTWNADNPRAQATRPSSQTVYDGNGKAEWTYDALGRGTRQEYNSRGLAFKTTHPDSTFETVSYDAEGRREIATDRRGKATKTVYDAMGRVSETIFLGGTGDTALTLSTTRYDAAGRVWQSTDANNNTTSYGYDDAGRRVTVVAAAVPLAGGGTVTPTTRYSYDPNGNLRFVTDPKGLVTEHVYNALNRRRQTILPAAALDLNGDGIIGSGEQAVVTSTSTNYDELGRRVSETDASNRTKRYGYDVLGRLRHVIDYAGQATRFDYDELGNQLSQTDANNHTTRYTYDNAGRRVTRTLPLGQQELLDYDDAGNLETRKDFNGRTTTFQYDPMNRLRFKIPDASLGEPTIQFTYNNNGQRETMSDASGITVYGYDGRGQLRTKQTPFGTLSYDYYPNGSLKQMWSSNANGVNVSYGYDALNRLETVGDANAGPTSYRYDANGNLESVLYPNGVGHAYGYNPLNRLTGLNVSGGGGTLASFGYAATPAGQRTSVSEGSGRTAGYGYDNLGRLQRETITGSPDGKNGIASYGYDNVGNRLSRTSSIAGITNQSFGYDWNDRLNGDQYDNNGNTKSAPVSQPTTINSQQVLGIDNYDSENRLVQRTGLNGVNVVVVYDGDGNRVQELVNGQIKNYLVDDRNPTGYAQVVEEIVSGVVNHTYTYGHDLISQDQFDSIAMAWRASFYGYDGRGTVRFLTDETGAVTDTYTYDAFGTLITVTGSTNNRYLYSGEQFDPNLGLYYLRARLMNPLTGRFWSMDSYEGDGEDPIALHKYLYGNADPANNSDPTGQFSLSEINVSTLISSTLRTMATGAIFGAGFGAADAYLGDRDVVQGALEGATVGAFLGPLGRIKILQPLLVSAGTALGTAGAYDAFMAGNYKLGLFRGLTLVAGARAVLRGAPPNGSAGPTGQTGVYRAVDPKTGETIYVGITKNFEARAVAHFNEKGIKIQEIQSLQNLPRQDARAIEQVLIEYYGLGKNHGTLLNKINSISANNPIYAKSLARGKELLQAAGFPGF